MKCTLKDTRKRLQRIDRITGMEEDDLTSLCILMSEPRCRTCIAYIQIHGTKLTTHYPAWSLWGAVVLPRHSIGEPSLGIRTKLSFSTRRGVCVLPAVINGVWLVCLCMEGYFTCFCPSGKILSSLACQLLHQLPEFSVCIIHHGWIFLSSGLSSLCGENLIFTRRLVFKHWPKVLISFPISLLNTLMSLLSSSCLPIELSDFLAVQNSQKLVSILITSLWLNWIID